MMSQVAISNTISGSSTTQYYYSVLALVIFMLSLISEAYFLLSTILFLCTVFMVLDRLGKGIILRELIALHSLFVCVFMPILGYTLYNSDNILARNWVRYMPVTEQTYFGYALPAMSIFVAVLCWPINVRGISDQGAGIQLALEKVKEKLQRLHNTSVHLIVIGVCAFMIAPFMPGFLQFVATLIFWTSFVGVLYLYFATNYKYRKLVLFSFGCFIVANAIQSGMFTIFVYMGITIFSFLFLGKRLAFWKKLLALAVALFLLIVIQSVKQTYRQLTWKQDYKENKIILFSDLIIDKLNSNTGFFTPETFFPVYYRTNQGFNVALVMRRFPSMLPHDNGDNLVVNLASSFVPRLFWPDKPEAGGKYNMKYYTGIEIRNWSTNVGPLGEAYGSFGVAGGIVFMFFLGLFVWAAYKKIFSLSRKTPLLICWIPVLFYQISYSAETDTLQILNSLIKSAFLVWILYKCFPTLFGVSPKQSTMSYRKRLPSYEV